MNCENKMTLEFLSKSANESFARAAVAAFVTQLDPTLEELADIKTAVSEGVTNAIIHGYGHGHGMVAISCEINGDTLTVTISDNGKGIENLELAMQPLYTSSPEMERSGMGFTVMETFMDEMHASSKPGEGTTVIMKKRIGQTDETQE